jgi:uncharacterized YigZ family protein
MSELEYYQTIDRESFAEFKDRGSKFLAYVYPVASIEEVKKWIQFHKKEHPKAVHHCFAYRLGGDGNQFRVSDDGEPSGTAGRPILGQIDSKQLTDVLVVVVRYFGGTLLGVPGLINAYKTAATLALQLIPVIQKPIEVMYELHFDYTLMNEVMMIVKQAGCSIAGQESQLFCLLKIGIPKAKLKEVLYRFGELHTLSIHPFKLK